METRVGGVAGVVAIATALALALAVTFMNPSGLDFATGTYTFTEPATEYVDDNLVLVQDGHVTDVWISEADRVSEYFGYTPATPASAFLAGDDSAVTTADDASVRQCWFVGTENEHCTAFADIRPLSAGEASTLAEWSGLKDGDFQMEGLSVTWDTGSPVHVTVDDGVIAAADPASTVLLGVDTAHPPDDWVRNWVDGADEPFALCHDDPLSSDEEECWTWSEITDARGA